MEMLKNDNLHVLMCRYYYTELILLILSSS